MHPKEKARRADKRQMWMTGLTFWFLGILLFTAIGGYTSYLMWVPSGQPEQAILQTVGVFAVSVMTTLSINGLGWLVGRGINV